MLTEQRLTDQRLTNRRLSDRTLVLLGRWMIVTAVLGVLGSTVAMLASGHGLWPHQTSGFVVLIVGFGIGPWLVLPTQPRNGSIWAMLGSVFLAGIGIVSVSVRVVLDSVPNDFDAFLGTSASELPLGPAIAVWPGRWTWVPASFLVPTIGFLLFPNGRLLTPRWRWIVWLSVVAMAMPAVTIAVLYFPTSTFTYDNPRGPVAELIQGTGLLGCLLLGFVALVSLLLRYRESGAEIRGQIRVVVFGAFCFLVIGLAALGVDLIVTGDAVGVGAEVGDPILIEVLQAVGMALFAGSFAVAVHRYRLYDVDLIISKSVAYLGLAAAITVIYVGVAVIPLVLLGVSTDDGPGLALPLAATAVVAVIFEPVRTRLQRWANRLVYGERSTPHEVLSGLTANLSETTENRPDELAKLVAHGTGAEQAVVWLRVGEQLRPGGLWSNGESASPPVPVPAGSLVDSPFDEELVAVQAVRHGDDELGAISITKSRREPVSDDDRVLLADVAAGSGLLLRNIGLNGQLERRAEEVRASRRRLIAARDTERHRLERDLHDGAQQHVVALKVKLGVARSMADKVGEGEIAESIGELTVAAQEAVDGLRAIAHGIYPPLLESEGLASPLHSIADSAAIPVDIRVSVDGRYPPPTEQTVYFCALEIINHAATAGADSLLVEVAGHEEYIDLAAHCNAADLGLAMTSVADRVDATEGLLKIETEDERTRLQLSVPAQRLEPA